MLSSNAQSPVGSA
jgi:hypothetical protein